MLCIFVFLLPWCFLVFCHNTFWFFLRQHHKYLNVLYVFWMFECFFDIAHFLPQFNYILFFIVMVHCFNTTFSPCFFCNFYNHFIYTQEKKIFFWWHKMLNNFSLKSLILYFSTSWFYIIHFHFLNCLSSFHTYPSASKL